MKYIIKLAFIVIIFTQFSCKQKEEKKEVKNETPITEQPVASQEQPQQTIESVSTEDGENIIYYADGKVKIKGMKKNGKREGLWVSWYHDGTKWSECEYKDGLKHGINISYYPNGKKLYEGKYKNDSQVGVWKYYEETGALSQEVNYDKKK